MFEDAGRIHDRAASLEAEQRQRVFLKDWGISTIDIDLDDGHDPVQTILHHLQQQQWLQSPKKS